MKLKQLRNFQVENIYLNEPRVDGGQIVYSWSENPLLDEEGLWIEYQDIQLQGPISMEHIAPYLPICLAFAVLGRVSVHLPYQIPEVIFRKWIKIIEDTAHAVYKKKKGFRLINGTKPLKETMWVGDKTALLFGGGAEALFTLGHLREENVKPILISYGGPGWDGSDPEINPHKLETESKISKDFGLKIFKIKTSFFELIYKPDGDWREYLGHHVTGMISAALFLPFAISAVLPVASQLNILRVVSGNEIENSMDPILYCFSHKSTKNLRNLSSFTYYESYLEDLYRHEIIRDLHLKFPQIAEYQYSCLKNKNKRWCLQCEKCFRNLSILKVHNIPLSRVGISEEEFKRGTPLMVQKTRNNIIKSPMHNKVYTFIFNEAKTTKSNEGLRLLKKVFNGILLLKIRYWIKLNILNYLKNR
jgi:hypothetical protein